MRTHLFHPKNILPRFDEYLHTHGARFEAIVIGAGALAVLGVITRQTHDFDVLSPTIPDEILKLAREFREQMKAQGVSLDDNWINNGPVSVGKILPKDWPSRVRPLFKGKALTLTTLGQIDFLRTKIDALCQRGTDFEDIVLMKPTKEELLLASEWVKQQDGNPGWPSWVDGQIQKLSEELGYVI